jgi:hypothetical protein
MCFLFSPSVPTYGVFPKFPLATLLFFLGVHFESSLEVSVTTLNKGYKTTNI